MSAFAAMAQGELWLVRKNEVVSRFEQYETIRIQLKGTKRYVSGVIKKISHDYIVLEDDTVQLRQISRVDLRRHSNKQFPIARSGTRLIAAGVLLLLIDVVNPNQSHTLSSGIVTAAAVFIGAGVTLQFVNNNYFKIGRRKKVMVHG
jgi:hypothetical protein